MKRKVHILITVLMLTLLMGTSVYAESFNISQTKATINIGDTIDLDISGTESIPKWTSYNVNIARVNQNGEVTAVRKGKTTISARIGLTYKKCTVTVVDTSITLNKKAATIYTGGTSTNTVQLKATAKGASKLVTWFSDNETVATVDSKGKVTSVSAGTANITASANGKSASCKITVLDSSILLNMSDLQLSTKGNGSSIKITPTVVGSSKSVKWTSSDSKVASVSGGTVKGKKSGTAVITASANGVSTTCNVTVVEGLISIGSEKELLYAGESKRLKTNAGKKDLLVWSSSNPEVATVDNGKITAIGAGTSIISVECNGKTDSCEVTVKDIVTSIKEDAVELKTKGTNKTFTLGFQVIGRKPTVKWTTSNSSVATVSNGKITAKKAGTATITATANGVSDSVQVIVRDFDPTIKLSQSEYVLYTGKGNTLTLKATVDGASKSVSWISSDSSVATVTNGKVKAIKEGQTLVSATANGVTADCIITVKESKVILETENINLNKGETAKLPVDVVGISQTVKYATTNSKAVTVKNGVVTAKNFGEADIKVTANGITAICHVNVSDCEHTFNEGIITKEPTCSEAGIRTYTCSKCDYSYTETVEKTAHTWSETGREESCENNGFITYTCSVCNETKQETTEPSGHNWGEWVVTKEPTETETGEKKHTCSRCQAEETDTIPVKEHEHKYTDTIVEPTCTEQGYTTHTCSCGETYNDTFVDALGHSWGEWVVIKEATQTEEGKKAQFCINCNSILATEPIAKTVCQHDYKIVDSVSATCTEKGFTNYRCENCGSTYSVEQEASGHSYDKTRTVEATCTQQGAVYKICQNCNHEEQTATLALKEHNYIVNPEKEEVEATCTEEGCKYFICSNCGYEKEEITTKEHTWNDGEITTEPTCVSSGIKTYTCGNCQGTRTEELEALGHDYREAERQGTACEEVIIYKCVRENCNSEKQIAVNPEAHNADEERIITEATCTTAGKKVKVCSVCGADVGEEILIPATGHAYGEWEVVIEATCHSEGSKTKSCEKCTDVQTEAIPTLEHTADEWKVEKAASCTEEGLKVLHCRECNVVLDTQTIAKEAHSYTELVETKEVTCTENGYAVYKCKDCDETVKQNIPATGHIAGEEITTPATDLAEGSIKQYCTECNALLKNEVLDKLPHTHNYAEEIDRQDATCSTAGYVIFECACGDTKRETLETTEHDAGTWYVRTEATCTSKGERVRKCNTCSTELETEEIPVIDHTYSEWVVSGNICYKECSACGNKVQEEIPQEHIHSYEEISRIGASCTEAGSVTYKCTGCDDTYSDDIPATGHIAGDWVVTLEPTYTEVGSKSKYCTTCSEVLETEEIPVLELTNGDAVYTIKLKGGSTTTVVGHYDTEKAADLAALVNAYRAENGLDTLEVTEFLQEKANIRGYQTSYYWEHLTPAGQSPTALYSYSAENLAWCEASTSAQDIFDALKDCEDHNAIMLSTYTKNRTATSVFCKKVGENDYEYYWVQIFK